jgi:hypothetical protein
MNLLQWGRAVCSCGKRKRGGERLPPWLTHRLEGLIHRRAARKFTGVHRLRVADLARKIPKVRDGSTI